MQTKPLVCSPKTYHSAREPKSSTYTLSLGEQPPIECVRCEATQSHGRECDEAAIALHRCVLFVFLQPDASRDSRRGSEAGGREGEGESEASEEDIKAAFIIHGRGTPAPPSHPPVLPPTFFFFT